MSSPIKENAVLLKNIKRDMESKWLVLVINHKLN